VSVLGPLRHPAFRTLIAGRTISALGNSFAPIALAFAVLDLTGSASDLGLVVGARTLVNVAFLLFGGVLADRLPKHLLMVASSLAAAVTQGIAAALVLTHTATIALLILLAGLNGMSGALALPASAAILPRTVPEEVRQPANAINRLSLNSAAIIGAPVAGIVVAAIGPGWGIAVDAVSFALAAVAFSMLRVPEAAAAPAGADPGGVDPPAAAPADRPHLFADLRTGWSEFRSRTWLWVVVAGFCVLNASWSGGLFVLGPVVADQSFGRRAWGFILAAQTAGMILGGLLALRLRLRRLLYFGVFATLFTSVTLFALGIYPHVWLLIGAALIAGLSLEQFGVAWETTMQEHIPADKLARVYSYDMVGSFVAMPIGEIAVGPISRAAGVSPTLIGAAVLMTIAVLFMLSSRDVRTLPHKRAEPAAEPMKESVA
jgi:MFS family permease